MPAYKDSRQGTWYASFYFENWQGVKQKKLKRGFATKKDALAWEREFLLQQAADLTMTFEAFVEIYITDKKKRLRENTWSTKEHIIRTKILPYFKEKRLSEIKPRDVIAWQNEMLNYRDKNGKAYSPTYLKTLHGQLSAILNHAVRFYGLKSNAAATAGCMGSEKHKEMLFWTKEEYLKFAEVMMDKPQSYYAFEVLYWCGIREGDDDDKIRLNQRKPSKYKGLRRFGPEKNLQRINKFMKERPIFYKNLIQMKENIRFYLRCFYCITKVMILQFNSENRTELARNG
jgi:integrase